jgi:hypothetical protein
MKKSNVGFGRNGSFPRRRICDFGDPESSTSIAGHKNISTAEINKKPIMNSQDEWIDSAVFRGTVFVEHRNAFSGSADHSKRRP